MAFRFKIYPYKQGSRSAKTLADALNSKVLKKEGSKFRPRAGDVVINWGSSAVPDFGPAEVLNRDVTVAQCKLRTFQVLSALDVRVPQFTTDIHEAHEWARTSPVVIRTVLNGHSGAGIVIAEDQGAIVQAPLYVKYVKKQDEYRVHVFHGQVIFVQRKARKLDHENPNWQIRNLAGGFAFVEVGERANIERRDHRWDCPDDVIDQAVDAIEALGLDFGGVDVIWNAREGRAYVLEVNTACGLEERTAERYSEAFLGLVEA